MSRARKRRRLETWWRYTARCDKLATIRTDGPGPISLARGHLRALRRLHNWCPL